ncbi:hypothetical protein BLA24_25170 [Streptomyces cinnamoneus]|uniref:Uncharacterized protein n=2 Tax=Streptomyces cinnamoneus TaxID=53446 RepID=A0A2G1XDR5_STRCJ|nr:hypothetical protein BLA24_25170 [Streptomyces cinnamoneus]
MLTGALAVAALVAALVALWQTQFGPLTRPDYCWGTWAQDGGPFHAGATHRTSSERAPTRRHPSGHCALSWRGGHGPKARDQRLDVRYDTGPEPADERRTWLAGLFTGGDSALPGGLPGFVTAASGSLVLPQTCDVKGLPSVLTISGTFADTAETARLLLQAADRAARVTGCAPRAAPRPGALPAAVAYAARAAAIAPGTAGCGIPALGREVRSAPAGRLTDRAGSLQDDFQTCAVASDSTWAARFTMTARPRIVALFAGLTGDGPPARGWRAHGRITPDGALVTADCAGRTTVFTMRSGPARTGTRLDDPREVFPDFVDAVAGRIGCAPLHSA